MNCGQKRIRAPWPWQRNCFNSVLAENNSNPKKKKETLSKYTRDLECQIGTKKFEDSNYTKQCFMATERKFQITLKSWPIRSQLPIQLLHPNQSVKIDGASKHSVLKSG